MASLFVVAGLIPNEFLYCFSFVMLCNGLNIAENEV